MPIRDKDLGRYNKPGIFIEEIDASVITLPVQDVLINLIPGFSKKGHVNTPVYVTNSTDFITIFGDVDRQLERKGSYFHRTCIKMLESGPIWALNLLTTNDTRDKLNWKSVSVSSYYDNDVTKQMPYTRAFNRQAFWKRDSEAFLDYVNDPTPDYNRLLHLTNMGDKVNTTFIFKSKTSGFDVSLEEWYGGTTKVPTYLNPKEWVSDYLVSVLIIEGDWTDYESLAVDSKWSKYFDTTGLLKGTVQDFVNENMVTTLGYYDASLIPYFKDITGRDMYIKNLINNGTDKTGLFCAFDEDLLMDSDFPTGKIDIIGDGLVGSEKSYIDFISYQENVVETISYPNQKLDENGNVFGNYSTDLTDNFYSPSDYRDGSMTNGYVHDASIAGTGQTLFQVNKLVNSGVSAYVWLDVALDDSCVPQGVPAGQTMLQVDDAVYFNLDYQNIVAGQIYYIVEVEQGGNQIQVSETIGGLPLTLATDGSCGSPVANGDLYVQRAYIELTIPTTSYFNIDNSTYTMNTASTKVVFEPLDYGDDTGNLTAYNRYDVLYLEKGDDATVKILKGTQSSTGTALKPAFNLVMSDYIILGYAHLGIRDNVTPGTGSTNYAHTVVYTSVALNSTGYVPLTDVVCTGLTIGTSNYVQITFFNTSGVTDNTNYDKLRRRQAYNEISDALGNLKGVIINRINGAKYAVTSFNAFDYSTTSNAILRINVGTTNATEYFDVNYKFLIYYSDIEYVLGNTNIDRLIKSALPLETLIGSGQTTSTNAGVIGKYSNMYIDIYNGIINSFDYGYENNTTGTTAVKFYINSRIENDTTMYVDFVSDTTAVSPFEINNWSTLYGSKFLIWSAESNYKQTVEVESFDTTKSPDKIFEIKVDKVRYSEIIIGSFLEGYYDANALEIGEDPRKMVRVISAVLDSTNSNWKVLKTDGAIKVSAYPKISGSGYDYATTSYPSIDVYVSTYKGIKLIPFTISTDSMPNGTDSRQSQILDVVAKTTKLARALANKNKITWRYMVDGFGLGLTAKSKQQLVDLCGLKLNCLGFINMPSVKQLKKSDNPSFINDDMTLNTDYLRQGGDQTKSPSFLYSFGEGVGATATAYFFPYLNVDDNGTPLAVPPAMFAASTYMKKFLTTQAGVEAWTIAAGITFGLVTGIGSLEFECEDDDITNLNKMGANPIVKKTQGFCIETENTAKAFPYSSLSLIHSREVLIELENSMYDMLLRYQWRFNTPEVRGEIKFKADKICKTLKDADALYNFANIMDERNNTNFIIDLQMGCIDTYIEIIKGMGIIVNNITILKKGDIESMGFA